MIKNYNTVEHDSYRNTYQRNANVVMSVPLFANYFVRLNDSFMKKVKWIIRIPITIHVFMNRSLFLIMEI